MRYFANLPILPYANNLARNLLTRVTISNTPSYYPYTLDSSSRIEHFAYDYYSDIDDVWILHHINKIVDPYYNYSLSTSDFDNYIIYKYGSIEKAKRDIIFYHNNYYGDDSTIDVSAYNALTNNLKKYWSPVLSVSGTPYEYIRARNDTSISTNRIISLSVNLTSNTQFQNNEKVTQNSTLANGFVTFSNSSVVTLKHISGTFNSNNITGIDSGAAASVTEILSSTNVIPISEQVYFSPVSYYEYEDNLNEKRKNIDVLDKRYVESVSSQFRQLLKDG